MGSREEVRRAKNNFTFENFEGRFEVSSETSEFYRGEIEFTKPFRIWHVTEASY